MAANANTPAMSRIDRVRVPYATARYNPARNGCYGTRLDSRVEATLQRADLWLGVGRVAMGPDMLWFPDKPVTRRTVGKWDNGRREHHVSYDDDEIIGRVADRMAATRKQILRNAGTTVGDIVSIWVALLACLPSLRISA
jgi:hypothetical protein